MILSNLLSAAAAAPDASTNPWWPTFATSITATLGALGGGLGGYWLAGRNDEARDIRAAAREAAARKAGLAERLEEARHTFQRDTLLQLQDELQRMTRIAAGVNFQDQKTLKEHGRAYQLPDELNDEAYKVNIAVRRLKVRILDIDLRAAVDAYTAQISRDGIAVGGMRNQSPEEIISKLEDQLNAQTISYEHLNELLGVQIRAELDRRYLAGESDSTN